MSFLKWMWRVILLIVVGCFVTTIYYMTHYLTHDLDMDMALPTLNIVGVAGVALLGVIWTTARKYWNVLVMLVALGLLRGLFNDELLTDFQSVWVLVSAGFVVFILLVVLIARVLREDHDRHVAAARAAAAQAAAQTAVTPSPAAGAPEPAPGMAKLVPPPALDAADATAARAGDAGDQQPPAEAPPKV